MASYEKLIAWKECHALALAVYRATEAFPRQEMYGLTAQARRAAFSAAANIAEGAALYRAITKRKAKVPESPP